MASNKFCLTQDEQLVEDNGEIEEGPIEVISLDQVSREPDPLFHRLEWTTLDLQNENELQELYNLLTNHYVEDNDAMFRLNYSTAFLNWCVCYLKAIRFAGGVKMNFYLLGKH
jgi:glycylpeptide N-tetradecanoyltransferase